MGGKKKKKRKDNSTNINFSPFPIETRNDQSFQNIEPPEKQTNSPHQDKEEKKDCGSIQTPSGQNKWKIKKEISIGDILTLVSAIGSIVAIIISVTALGETKKQFKILNEPYLEISKPALVFYDSIPEIKIIYSLENLKPYPAQIIIKTQKIILDTSSALNTDSIFETLKEDSSIYSNGKNAYVIKETPLPYQATFYPHNGLTPFHYNKAKYGVYFIYLVDIVRYKDVVSGNNREYRTIIKMKNIKSTDGSFYAEYQYNENKDLDNN